MTSIRMRPRFSSTFATDASAAKNAILGVLEENDHDFNVRRFDKEIIVSVAEKHRTPWSPYLHLRFDSDGVGNTVVRGRFSPHPNVWTAFMMIYGVLTMLGMFGEIYGLAQWSLGKPTWALASMPIAISLIAFVYGASLIGQGLTNEQMFQMRSTVERACEQARASFPPSNA
ncbi:MAG: hypothetical protein R3A47_05975 [Polyangiales bacterium]